MDQFAAITSDEANPGRKSAIAAQVAQNQGGYDLCLAGCVLAGRLTAGRLLGDFDPARVPNPSTPSSKRRGTSSSRPSRT
jgi:hypothetical protein